MYMIMDQMSFRMCLYTITYNFMRVIGGGIIKNIQLKIKIRLLQKNTVNGLLNIPFLVIGDHADTDGKIINQ